MWNRLKAAAAAASNVVQSLDDMLNQPSTDPLEEFEHYWKCVQLEHNEIVEELALSHARESNVEKNVDEEQQGSELRDVTSGDDARGNATARSSQQRRSSVNDVSILKNSGIKEHLEQLVTLLRDEEADDKIIPRTSMGTVRPCLSYMLEHHVVEILCAMALADQPRGMMALVLQVIKLMLHHVDQVKKKKEEINQCFSAI